MTGTQFFFSFGSHYLKEKCNLLAINRSKFYSSKIWHKQQPYRESFFTYFPVGRKSKHLSLPGTCQQHLPRFPSSQPPSLSPSLPWCRKPGENLGEVSGQCTACKQKLPCPPWTQMFPIDPPVGLADCNCFRTSCSPSAAHVNTGSPFTRSSFRNVVWRRVSPSSSSSSSFSPLYVHGDPTLDRQYPPYVLLAVSG